MNLKRPVNFITNVKIIKINEWLKKGLELFGEDVKSWRFKCSSCGNIQSYYSIKKNNPHINYITESMVYYSCEGRINKNIYCDWTLGGLFKIHETEVEDEEGNLHPVFEFSDK